MADSLEPTDTRPQSIIDPPPKEPIRVFKDGVTTPSSLRAIIQWEKDLKEWNERHGKK